MDVLHSLLPAVFDAERAFFPGFFQRGFVAAQVNHGGGKDVPELVKDGGIEFPYFRLVGAYQVQAHTAGRADFRVVVWKAEEFRIGGGQRLVVARHVYFRDDLNAARGAVRHQVFQFLPGVHSFVGSAVAEAFLPFGRDAFQFGIARHRQAPALVVRQVELELVEFIVGHHVHEFLQVLHGDEVAGGVHHHAAPRVARLVLDDSAGNAFRMRRQLVLELLEGDQSVDTALFPAGREVHSLRGDGELVGVLAQGRRGFVGKKLQGPGGVPLQLRFLRLRNNAVFFCCFSLKYREQQQSGQEWKKPCHVFSISRAGRESFKNLLLHEHAAEYASCPLKGYGGPFDKMFLRNYRGWHPGSPDTSSFQGKRKGRKEGRPFVFFPWFVWRC